MGSRDFRLPIGPEHQNFEERDWQVWLLAHAVAQQAEDELECRIEAFRKGEGPEPQACEYLYMLKLRAQASRAALAVLAQVRDKPI